MASEQLNVANRAANSCSPPRSERDEGAPSGMRRAAFKAELGVERLEPVHDTAGTAPLATFRFDDVACTAGLAAEFRKSLAQTGVQRDHPPRTLFGDTVSQRDLAADVAASIEDHRQVALRSFRLKPRQQTKTKSLDLVMGSVVNDPPGN